MNHDEEDGRGARQRPPMEVRSDLTFKDQGRPLEECLQPERAANALIAQAIPIAQDVPTEDTTRSKALTTICPLYHPEGSLGGCLSRRVCWLIALIVIVTAIAIVIPVSLAVTGTADSSGENSQTTPGDPRVETTTPSTTSGVGETNTPTSDPTLSPTGDDFSTPGTSPSDPVTTISSTQDAGPAVFVQTFVDLNACDRGLVQCGTADHTYEAASAQNNNPFHLLVLVTWRNGREVTDLDLADFTIRSRSSPAGSSPLVPCASCGGNRFSGSFQRKGLYSFWLDISDGNWVAGPYRGSLEVRLPDEAEPVSGDFTFSIPATSAQAVAPGPPQPPFLGDLPLRLDLDIDKNVCATGVPQCSSHTAESAAPGNHNPIVLNAQVTDSASGAAVTGLGSSAFVISTNFGSAGISNCDITDCPGPVFEELGSGFYRIFLHLVPDNYDWRAGTYADRVRITDSNGKIGLCLFTLTI